MTFRSDYKLGMLSEFEDEHVIKRYTNHNLGSVTGLSKHYLKEKNVTKMRLFKSLFLSLILYI